MQIDIFWNYLQVLFFTALGLFHRIGPGKNV